MACQQGEVSKYIFDSGEVAMHDIWEVEDAVVFYTDDRRLLSLVKNNINTKGIEIAEYAKDDRIVGWQMTLPSSAVKELRRTVDSYERVGKAGKKISQGPQRQTHSGVRQ